ncbi:MAG TPA: magnesium transporter [Candidatus Fimenecus excrementigallinarum]|uniref:Magnesium transporter MgtE n=1 Tax=Candidatus Fimenecus excrementigallinarum TaxID=2840816 RepID=A0A9D1LEF1_9FIRM|nr:magnesium transporter [Candidatus Fimenecus excrementigallinarum]
MYEKITELLEKKAYPQLKEILSDMNEADIAAVLKELPQEKLPLVYRILPKELAAEVFVNMDSDDQEFLIRAFSDNELREVLDEMYVDDAVDVIEEMPATVVKRILQHTDPEMRKSINEILQYPEDSAGSLMTTEYVDLKKYMTVADAFTRIRRTGVDKETIYICYVTDENRKLLGIVTVKDLLLSDSTDKIFEIMDTNIISTSTLEDKEVVAEKFRKYDLLALPVVDRENRLVGIITIDDAMDVLQDENTEDIEKMAAITPTDKPYLKMGVFEIWKKRFPWLLLLMVSATFTGRIIQSFESALQAYVVLTAYIPMLMGTGGNCGAQSSTTIIRGLSLGEIRFRDTFKVIWKEFRVAFFCGATLAAVNFGRLMLMDHVSVVVAAIVSLSMILTIVLAKFIGSLLPILAKRIHLDPAVMANPFISTIVDALSLLIYFEVASWLLPI